MLCMAETEMLMLREKLKEITSIVTLNEDRSIHVKKYSSQGTYITTKYEVHDLGY